MDAPVDELDNSLPVDTVESAVTGTPAFRSFMHTQNGLSVMKPAGLVTGDFMLAALEYDADPLRVTPPTGWTLVVDQKAGAGTPQVLHTPVYSHIATANEPAEYMFTAPAGVYVDITIAAYTGATQVDKVSGAGALTSTIVAPSLNTSVANELLVGFFVDFEFGNWTTATGMTVRANFDANSLQDAIIPVSPTGKRPASNTNGQQAAVNILLK
jgi:hypothetical protein